MKQTTAPSTTPSPKQSGSSKDPSTVFVAMTLDMSWRLAIAVLVPIAGGFKLDEHFNTSPWLGISGLVLAILLSVLVVRHTVELANKVPVPKLTAAQKAKIKAQYEEEDDD